MFNKHTFDYICIVTQIEHVMDNSIYGQRILSKGRITDLSKGFSLKNGVPFSVYVRPKGESAAADAVIDCKLICDRKSGPFPVPVGDWTPGMMSEIAADGISLDDFDVYWGSGETGEEA